MHAMYCSFGKIRWMSWKRRLHNWTPWIPRAPCCGSSMRARRVVRRCSAQKKPQRKGGKGRKTGARSAQNARGNATAKDGVASKRPRKARAAKSSADAGSGAMADTAATKRRARGAKKSSTPAAVKYKDPASDKTWSGRGRRPAWLSGDPDQYLVSNLGSSSKGNPDAPEPANQTAS